MISIGSKQLVDCQVGSKKVKEIYKGSTKIWPSWNLLYEADVTGGGDSGPTLATIPNYVSGTTKIKIVISYISGTWVNKFPAFGTGEQSIRFGNPAAYVEFNADVSPLSAEHLTKTTANTTILQLMRASTSGNFFNSTTWYIDNNTAQLVRASSGNDSSIVTDPIHMQVYYQ